MKTIAFYSYKGGTGRSLALANAARYLARLKFKVVALDLDLEAPGLHYKFSNNSEGSALSVDKGVVDYISSFINSRRPPESLGPYSVDVPVPGVEQSLTLIPAGSLPSKSYWSKLSGIDWHSLFYLPASEGVEIFMEFKSRIEDELKPDFLLIDSRTGITEMGGVATTLLADQAICVVLPTRENLDGARAVLQSMQRTRRENGQAALDLMVALSRVTQSENPDDEGARLTRVREILSEPALESDDTIECPEIFVLHHETGLEIQDALRVGSGMSPDDSVLLRDYLRLFANVVPAQSVASRLEALIQAAKNKVWDGPEGPDVAQKELEELAESFGRPEIYRALLHMYTLRNVSGLLMLRTAQRLWDITRDSTESLLWQIVRREFRPSPGRQRDGWTPRVEFIEAIWREAGRRDPEFAIRLAEALSMQRRVSHAADLLLEVVNNASWTPAVLAVAIRMLDEDRRSTEADRLIANNRELFEKDQNLADVWVQHALRSGDPKMLLTMTEQPASVLGKVRSALAAHVYGRLNMTDEARAIADDALRDLRANGYPEWGLADLGRLFEQIGRWEDFEQIATRLSPFFAEEIRRRMSKRRRELPNAWNTHTGKED